MSLSGHTTPYAVLGHPIGHSLSPVMHNASIDSLGLDAIYLAFDVDPSVLIDTLESMGNMGFNGVNLTVPLKEVAFNGISQLDDSARTLGAVNTIKYMDDGTLKGYNTDGEGFLLAIKEDLDCTPEGLSVFVLGCGGAGRAVALTSAISGCSSITISDIDNERSERLKSEIAQYAPNVSTEVIELQPDVITKASLNADLVIQATPVGMKPEDRPLLSAEAFRSNQMLFDLIYMYPQTGIMKAATEAGAKTANGLDMLMYQGAHAWKIWTGTDPDYNAMRNALKKEVYKL